MGNTQIHYYELGWLAGTEPLRLSTNDTWFNNDTTINNQGQVVWYKRPTEYGEWWLSEVYYYNISWLSDPTKTPQNISNQPFSDVHPQISDQGHAVWIGTPGTQDIYHYDLSWAPGTPPQNISNSIPPAATYEKINNRGQVVWVNNDTGDLYYYDLSWEPGTPPQYLASKGSPTYYGLEWKINDLGQLIWVTGTSPGGGGQIYVASPFDWVTIDIKPGILVVVLALLIGGGLWIYKRLAAWRQGEIKPTYHAAQANS